MTIRLQKIERYDGQLQSCVIGLSFICVWLEDVAASEVATTAVTTANFCMCVCAIKQGQLCISGSACIKWCIKNIAASRTISFVMFLGAWVHFLLV